METEESNQAVDASSGKVMTYNGKLVIAYYHASSGGHTEDSQNVWSAALPYLKGVPDQYSTMGKDWEYSLAYTALKDKLNQHGLGIADLKEIKPGMRTASARYKDLVLVTDTGTSKLTGNNFRIKVGSTRLRSTRFIMSSNDNGIKFKGNGYGHGVGMSQQGARQMALSGFKYNAILKHYYTDVKITMVR